MRLYLIRHPRTLTPADVCYGGSDVLVDPHEREACVQRLLADVALPRGLPLYASPLSRCAELAQRLAGHWGGPALILDPRLQEMDFGAWEMRSWADISHSEVDAWVADLIAYRPGGGESVLQMARRVQQFRADITARGEDACVVCHAGTIRLLTALQGGKTLEDAALAAAQTARRIGYGELVVLACD